MLAVQTRVLKGIGKAYYNLVTVLGCRGAKMPRCQGAGWLVFERALDPLSVRFEGDHLLREPLDYLSGASFEVEQLERSKWGIVERVVARKPREARTAA